MSKFTAPIAPNGMPAIRASFTSCLGPGNARSESSALECADGTIWRIVDSGPITVTCGCGAVKLEQAEGVTKIRYCKTCKVTITIGPYHHGRVA